MNLIEAVRDLLQHNGGPISSAEQEQRDPHAGEEGHEPEDYVMVRRQDFDALATLVSR